MKRRGGSGTGAPSSIAFAMRTVSAYMNAASARASPLSHSRRGLREIVAAARPDLDLGGDQLPHQVILELGVLGGGLQLLEPVGQGEGFRIEDRELLLDRDAEVLGLLEGLTRLPDLLLRAQSLCVAHGR